jgi:hypothetical protein
MLMAFMGFSFDYGIPSRHTDARSASVCDTLCLQLPENRVDGGLAVAHGQRDRNRIRRAPR